MTKSIRTKFELGFLGTGQADSYITGQRYSDRKTNLRIEAVVALVVSDPVVLGAALLFPPAARSSRR